MTVQRKYGLPVCKEYPEGYAVLVRKLVYMSVCAVSSQNIKALLKIEKGLLELLKVDSFHASPLWFESLCVMKTGPTRLLLSGYDIGQPVSADSVQTGLDFGEREKELFGEREMGSDALRGLKRYDEAAAPIRQHLAVERFVVREALKWCNTVA